MESGLVSEVVSELVDSRCSCGSTDHCDSWPRAAVNTCLGYSKGRLEDTSGTDTTHCLVCLYTQQHKYVWHTTHKYLTRAGYIKITFYLLASRPVSKKRINNPFKESENCYFFDICALQFLARSFNVVTV